MPETTAQLPRSFSDRVARWERRGKITRTDSCWVWSGSKTKNGYGMTEFGGRKWMIHRLIYTHLVGPIPAGLDIDHRCHDPKTCPGGDTCPHRACVNPAHLEPATRSENLSRGHTERTHFASKTHCPQHHPYDATNTARRDGRRICKACDRARAQRNRDKVRVG